MSQQIIQINFSFDMPTQNFEAAAPSIATKFVDVPGLVWKIWLFNKGEKEAGGIYLFENEEAAEDYKKSDLFKRLSNNPAFVKLEVKQFAIIEGANAITRAPVYIRADQKLKAQSN